MATQNHGSRRHSGAGRLLAGAVLIFSLVALVTDEARACWTSLLTECFSRPATQWPWAGPAGSGAQWRHSPNDPMLHWGIQAQYYDQRICATDQQAAWIIGDPTTEDPRYDGYAPNLDTYMTYGPINLSNVVAANVLFFLYCRSEPSHDSVYWGAATASGLTAANMQVSGSFYGRMQSIDFQEYTMDLSNLRNYTTHDSVSMIGEPAVFIFFRFKADGNSNPPPPTGDVGAFVDEVIIAVDDGGIDLRAGSLNLLRPDSSDFPTTPQLGDTVWASFDWSTCDGGVLEYPEFRVTGTVTTSTQTLVVLDTVMTGVQPNTRYRFFTNTWVNETPDDYCVRVKLDTLGEVGETSEINNQSYQCYYIPAPNPAPVFTWVAPATDTLLADTIAMIRWICTDPDEIAHVSLYYDQDQFGCVGVNLPGGVNREEHDGPDSLAWDVHTLPQFRTLYVFANVVDEQNQFCTYGPYPVVIDHPNAVGERRDGLPAEFALEQNYPNPFNPSTEIRYSVAAAGAVKLRVFDIQGRDVATLVDEAHAPGNYRVQFDGSALASGIYLYQLTAPATTLTRKMVLMK
ncbi:T9SS type A sorting domain-containing protein [candidate division KSB1 bacterium]|nr:T9SS type A sorting domain-containing protein [candidate division KSB1 bacterium]